MIQYASGGKESFKGKRVAITGSGNVAQYAALKCIELGATVISLSDSKGCLIATDEQGITPDLVNMIADMKVKRKQLAELANSSEYSNKFRYIGDGARPWIHCGKVDVALPSATAIRSCTPACPNEPTPLYSTAATRDITPLARRPS